MRSHTRLLCLRFLGLLLGVWCLGGSLPSAQASVLYLGLPDGQSIAYEKDGNAAWTRAAAADLPSVSAHAFPTLADLDHDADHDALVGELSGHVRAFRNVGSDGVPVWTRHPAWDPPFDFGGYAAPALGDVDRDGDADLLVGNGGGNVRGVENIGSAGAPAWQSRGTWDLLDLGDSTRPGLGDVDGDGRPDLLVGLRDGAVLAFAGTGVVAAPFARRASWDPPADGARPAVALGDLDGNGRPDLLVTDALAMTRAFRNAGGGVWIPEPLWSAPDPGVGPAGPALRSGTVEATDPTRTATPIPTRTTTPISPRTATRTPPPSATPSARVSPTTRPTPANDGSPIALLDASPSSGEAPLTVAFDATRSYDPEGDQLTFAWDFGDGSVGQPPDDPAAAILAGDEAYEIAKAARDGGDFPLAVDLYLAAVDTLLPLTGVAVAGPPTAHGTNRIDRVARWYLQKIGHDLGAIYLFRGLGLATCERYATSLQYSRESAAQARAGGFPDLPAVNGTNENIAAATQSLIDRGCAVPAPAPMFGTGGPSGPTVIHHYVTTGRYLARVTVSDGIHATSASVTITVGNVPLPATPTPPRRTPSPPPSPTGEDDPLEGFGTSTRGGEGGREIHVTAATEAAVRAAFDDANDGRAVIVFDVTGPIAIRNPLPQLTGSFITVEGNGVALDGTGISPYAAMVDIRGHDVIVRNMRLRNAGDNLRVQQSGAYNVVLSHISSTGASDDGVSIGYGAHDVTLQHSFLAGNTRSIFVKYKGTTRVSIHHTWVMKQWIRGPIVSSSALADVRNIIVEDWTSWGARFESAASGNVVNSLFVLSPHARQLGGKPASALRLIQSGQVFTAGNVYRGQAEHTADGNAGAPLDAPPVTTLPVADMEDLVRARAGCLPRDTVDRAYIDMANGWTVKDGNPLRLEP